MALSTHQLSQATAFLSTQDTALTLIVASDNSIAIHSLQHPAAGWDWVEAPGTTVPMPLTRGANTTWVFDSIAVSNTTDGQTVSLFAQTKLLLIPFHNSILPK